MIFDNSSKQYDVLNSYMGKVQFNSFRKTGYYSVIIAKDAEKERFLKDHGLPVKTVSDVLKNWGSTGMTKFINGKWYVNNKIAFNVQHELRHQNYSFSENTSL